MAVKVTRAEARLEALRGVGVDVSRWLEKAQGDRSDKSTSDLTCRLRLLLAFSATLCPILVSIFK